MPGPLPKAPELRQRRNVSATRRALPAETGVRRKPRLPSHPSKREWHEMARRWWADVWASPMSYEFLTGDHPALFRLVVLVDTYWTTLELDVAREIRLMEREFGLTPLSRRRLEWNVAQAEESKDKLAERRVRGAKVIDQAHDPRMLLEG